MDNFNFLNISLLDGQTNQKYEDKKSMRRKEDVMTSRAEYHWLWIMDDTCRDDYIIINKNTRYILFYYNYSLFVDQMQISVIEVKPSRSIAVVFPVQLRWTRNQRLATVFKISLICRQDALDLPPVCFARLARPHAAGLNVTQHVIDTKWQLTCHNHLVTDLSSNQAFAFFFSFLKFSLILFSWCILLLFYSSAFFFLSLIEMMPERDLFDSREKK